MFFYIVLITALFVASTRASQFTVGILTDPEDNDVRVAVLAQLELEAITLNDTYIIVDRVVNVVDQGNETLNMVNNDNIDVLFGGGKSGLSQDSKNALDAIHGHLENTEVMLWHPLPSLGRFCSTHHVQGGAVPNQSIERAMMWLLHSFPNRCHFHIILLTETSPDNSIDTFASVGKDIVTIFMESYNATVYHIEVTRGAIDAVDVVNKIVDEYSLDDPSKGGNIGGPILSLLTDPNDLGAVADELEFRQFEGEAESFINNDYRYPLLCLGLNEQQIFDALDDEPSLKQHFFFSNYQTSLNIAANDKFKLMNNIEVTENAVTAVDLVALWANKVTSSVYEGVKDLASALPGTVVNSPSGDGIEIYNNLHLSKHTFVGKVINRRGGSLTTFLSSTHPAVPFAWNPTLNDRTNYKCDITNPSIGVKYTVDTIKVGILHSLSGSMAASERSVVDATMIAIQKLNDEGGVLGQRIEPKLADSASTVEGFQAAATELLDLDVAVVFGCWSSSCRTTVIPQFEAAETLLFYPLNYEGQECSRNVFYTGAETSQQVIPSLEWLLLNKGKQFFLVGNDNRYSTTVNEIANAFIPTHGGEVVGEVYANMDDTDSDAIDGILNAMLTTMPNGGLVFNTLFGTRSQLFFSSLYHQVIDNDKYIICSMSLSDVELNDVRANIFSGHYFASSYFNSIGDTTAGSDEIFLTPNQDFIDEIQSRMGDDRVVSEPMNAGYIGVHMWAIAAEQSISFETDTLREAAYGLSLNAPEGPVTMQQNHHLSKFFRMGQVRSSGFIDIVHEALDPLIPNPWSQYIESSKNKGCSHSTLSSQELSGEQFDLSSVEIALIHSFNSFEEQSQAQLSDALYGEKLAINEINAAGGLLGKQVVPRVINSDNEAQVNDVFNNDKIVALFGCNTAVCQQQISDRLTQASTTSRPLTLLRSGKMQSAATSCNKNILQFGLTTNQKIFPVIDWFASHGQSQIVLVTRQDQSTVQTVVEDVEKYLGSSSSKSMFLSSLSLNAESIANVSNLKEKISRINEQCGERGCLLVNLMEDVQSLSNFINGAEASLLNRVRFPILSTSIAVSDFRDFGEIKGFNEFNGEYFVDAYFKDSVSPYSRGLVSQVYYGVSTSLIVSAQLALSYESVKVWQNTVLSRESFELNGFRGAVFNIEYKMPRGGVEILFHNHVKASVMLAKADELGNLMLVYESEDGIEARPEGYSDGDYNILESECYAGPSIGVNFIPYVILVPFAVIGMVNILTFFIISKIHSQTIIVRRTHFDSMGVTILGCIGLLATSLIGVNWTSFSNVACLSRRIVFEIGVASMLTGLSMRLRVLQSTFKGRFKHINKKQQLIIALTIIMSFSMFAIMAPLILNSSSLAMEKKELTLDTQPVTVTLPNCILTDTLAIFIAVVFIAWLLFNLVLAWRMRFSKTNFFSSRDTCMALMLAAMMSCIALLTQSLGTNLRPQLLMFAFNIELSIGVNGVLFFLLVPRIFRTIMQAKAAKNSGRRSRARSANEARAETKALLTLPVSRACLYRFGQKLLCEEMIEFWYAAQCFKRGVTSDGNETKLGVDGAPMDVAEAGERGDIILSKKARRSLATIVFNKYIKTGADSQVNISSTMRDKITSQIKSNCVISSSIFDKAVEETTKLIEQNLVKPFFQSSFYDVMQEVLELVNKLRSTDSEMALAAIQAYRLNSGNNTVTATSTFNTTNQDTSYAFDEVQTIGEV